MSAINLVTIFLTGLTTGSITCLALQGGLLASAIAQQKSHLPSRRLLSVFSFLFGKLAAHALLGFLLGILGSSITLSAPVRGWFQIIIGIYLIGIAGNLLELHPLFRYFVFTPPKFLARIVRNESKSQSIFAPLLLGISTIFIPCAVTQATEVIAISSGSPFYGAAVMFSFVLGTFPSFIIFGLILNSGAGVLRSSFTKIAAVILLCLSLVSINNGLGLTGSVYTFQNFYEAAVHPEKYTSLAVQGVIQDGSQVVTINVSNNGYSPQVITLKKGVPVHLTLNTTNVQNCSRSFSIPTLNIEKLLPETGETIVDFTPSELGPLAFSCSMGMYTGLFNIVN